MGWSLLWLMWFGMTIGWMLYRYDGSFYEISLCKRFVILHEDFCDNQLVNSDALVNYIPFLFFYSLNQ